MPFQFPVMSRLSSTCATNSGVITSWVPESWIMDGIPLPSLMAQTTPLYFLPADSYPYTVGVYTTRTETITSMRVRL